MRNQEVGLKKIKLDYFEEAFTTENWIVRIYRRKPRKNRETVAFMSKQLAATFPLDTELFKKRHQIFDDIKFSNKAILKKKKITA